MKNRSHRLPVSEPHHDDWGDGSWTVDCVCGVNFDDGEEMVDCDECGVWVHTRCSRYVKSEKSFACDKCKNKNTGSGGACVRNDSEEAEVAEFLVELPTKTLRMDNPNPASVSTRRPFRLWTEIPMEERVHVQGVPGGEPGLFSGIKMSSIFGPELWKSTGYVPKKFDFKYTEFPCFSQPKVLEKKEEEMDRINGEENVNQADNGVAVLFSLSKENENTFLSPAVNSAGVKRPAEGGGCIELVSPTQKKLDGEDLNFACPRNSVKESSSVPIVLHSGKRKKEDIGMSKDQNVKKKMRTVEKEGDAKKRAGHASKAASTFSSDAKNLEFTQDRSSKAAGDDIRYGNDFLGNQLSDGLGEYATNLASNGPEATHRNDISSDEISREQNKGDQVPEGSGNSSKTNSGAKTLTKPNGSGSTPVKEEAPGDTLQSCGDVGRGAGSVEIGLIDKVPVAMDVRIVAPDSKESQHGQESDNDEANSRPNKKLKGDPDADDHVRHYAEPLPPNDVKFETLKATTQNHEASVNVLSEESKAIETSVMSSEASDAKLLDSSRSLTVNCRADKADESPDSPYQSKQEASSEGSGARKRSSGSKHSSGAADELLKSNGTVRSHSTASYQRKTVVSVMKSSSTSRVIMPKVSENRASATAQNPSIHGKQKELSESTVGTMKEKDNVLDDTVEHDEKCGRPKKFLKEPSRSNSLSKISESTKLSHTSDPKKPPSDSKDTFLHSSSSSKPKVPLMPNTASNRVSGERTSPPPSEIASNVQNKAAASAVSGKGEKFSHSGSHSSSKGNVAPMTAPASSNVPATLSDEELALLLHQELNSSPRVPRVPRMRNAGSLPQLTCPTATSTLMKRTSSVGGKDHGLASRRRTKDFPGDGSLEVDNEAKKMDRKPSSPDNRRQDSGCSTDPLNRREADSGPVKNVQSLKKNVSSSLSSSDANGHNLSSSRSSSRNASDDDPRIAGRPGNRTLPGLIAEIMSEGKRMTYEELCNAVLPHWPHLRKHNGERYAYSSHSQAVLDCLRNRSEWARLVDRGPKTNASRKRRKLDADSMSIDSEDNEENRVKNPKDVGSKSFESHQEDFPKGKRKARKRRLALQGRGIVRRRRRADVVSDDESESFSNSSGDTMSSEEEIQGGGGTSIVGSEASASSDEVR